MTHKRTIAVKRAELFREWLFSCYANDESYYMNCIVFGVPDGDDMEQVLSDLRDGFYDDDIDMMLFNYKNCREWYGKAGFYYNGNVYHNPLDCIDAAGIELPERIYKRKEA